MLQNPDLEEKLKRYWMGKRPNVKAATMEYIAAKGKKTQAELAKRYGIRKESVMVNVRELKKLGVVVVTCHLKLACMSCGVDLTGIFPKFAVAYHKNSNGSARTRGYLCTDCAKRFPVLQKKE